MRNALLLGLGLLVTPFAAARPPSDIQSRLDGWIQGQAGGAAIAWVDQDGTAFFETGGFDREAPRPITADTQFELGSITKIFTALLLAESERLGKVSRDDPAAKFLLAPDDPMQPALAKITLRSLASHTAGLPRLPANLGPNPDASDDPYAAYDRAALVEALRLHGPSAAVGSSPSYSNFGFSVLGEALAAAWGTSYADALQAHVIGPLRMTSTTLAIAGSPSSADLAPGHVGAKRVPNWTFLACAPAAGARSSARDMAKFLTACLGGPNAPLRAALAATVQPQFSNNDVGGQIGLGWMLTDAVERPIVWHNGATSGSHVFVAFSPRLGAGVAILANVQKGSEEFGFALLGGTPPSPRTQIPNASDYLGRYPLTTAFVIQIATVNGSLFAQATGQPRVTLRPTAPDHFAVIGVPAEIWFERNAEEKVSALVLHQNGVEQRAPRGKLPPLAERPKEIAQPAEILREYVGEYPLAPQFALTVTADGGALWVQATGQPIVPVFASARDEFFYKVVDAQLTFERDANGKVAGVTLHQNGMNLHAAKAK